MKKQKYVVRYITVRHSGKPYVNQRLMEIRACEEYVFEMAQAILLERYRDTVCWGITEILPADEVEE